ncbi:MAG: ROK family protein [Acidobacteriia bacterium]|nr:ROK family protein [Terriglobia bacterium]
MKTLHRDEKASRMDYAVSVDLGGTNMRVAAVDSRGRILEERRIPTRVERGRDDVVRRMCDLIIKIIASRKAGRCVGVGVGVPGLVYYNRELHESPNFPGRGNFPFKRKMEGRLPVPVIIDNDANVAALGEVWKGAARDVENACLFTLGTGVGCGIVLRGKIWSGTRGIASEAGHMVVDPDGELCNCGTRGCLETIAAAPWMVRRAHWAGERGESEPLRKLFAKKKNASAFDVCRIAEQGDPAARRVFQLAGRALGLAVANLTTILDLQKFIIAGGAANAWKMFSPSMKKEAFARSYVYRAERLPIVQSRLIDKAGLLGAARLVWQEHQD